MQFLAKASYVRYSPYKLRPLADVVRGKNTAYALAWLATYRNQRTLPLAKLIASAAANAKNLKNFEAQDLAVKELRVDQGPVYKYFKPGAQGRAMPQRKRLCHITVVLEPITKEV